MIGQILMSAQRAPSGPSSATDRPAPSGPIGVGSGDRSSTAAAAALADMDRARSSARMVTFSVDHPGGGGMTTMMSAVAFRAALASDDPGALGRGVSGDGDSYTVKDILLKALGLESAAASSPTASAPAGAAAGRISGRASSGSTDLLIASALLDAMATAPEPGAGSDERDAFPIAATVSPRWLSGTQDGVRFSIAVASRTAGSSGAGATI